MSASPTEGTDMNQIEKVARAIIGPHEPVPASSRYTLDELREVRWRQITSDERSMALREAKAAIAAMQPAPHEPVGSPAEITRLTEALRAAEEREKALLSALEEWMFRYFWRVDGMPVEAARIHAQSRMKIAALAGAKP